MQSITGLLNLEFISKEMILLSIILVKINADEWNWTTDLLVTNQLLYPWATPALESNYHLSIYFLDNLNKPESNLDPNLRARLLKETKNPYRGLRRAVWIALFGSAALGLFIMVTNIIAGDTVSINDLAIQTSALVILGFLLFKDRSKEKSN